MYSSDRQQFILQRLFLARSAGRVPHEPGSFEQQVKQAFSANLFTSDELRWLNEKPVVSDAFVRSIESRITQQKPSVGFIQQALAKVGGIESWDRMMFCTLNDVDVAGLVITGQTSVDSVGIGVPIGFGYTDAKALAERVDVLVVSNEFGLVGMLKDAVKRPVVVFVHHGDVTCASSARAVLTQANYIDVLASVHPATGARFADVIPRVEYMPNAVDPNRCKPENETLTRETARQIVGLPGDAKVVLYSGRFSMDKGYSLARAIGERLPSNFYLVMMGGEQDTDHPQIRYVGRQRWPGTWYRAADIGISTSVEEGAGLSMMEMAYCGLPIVATRRGVVAAHPEMARVMLDGATVSDWISALTEELGNPARIKRRVGIARAIVNHHYSIERFGKAWNKLLLEIGHARTAVR